MSIVQLSHGEFAFAFLLYLLLATSCFHDGKTHTTQNTNIIDVSAAISNDINQMLLSDVAEDLEIIPLYTSEKSVFDYSKIKHIVSYKNGFLISVGNQIKNFSRKGDYIRDVGFFGQAPTAFLYPESVGYNDQGNEIYVTSGFSMTNDLRVYDVDGKYKRSLKIAKDGEYITTSSMRIETAEYRFIDGYHVLRRMLPIPDMRREPWQIMVKDSLNNFVSTIVDPTLIQFRQQLINIGGFDISRAGEYWSAFEPVICCYKGKRSIMFDGNDTIYNWGKAKRKLFHRYLLKTGSQFVAVKDLHQLDKTEDYLNRYVHPIYLMESRDFLYVVVEHEKYAYLCKFNKKTGEICSIRNKGEIRFSELMNVHYRRIQLPQFTDDITGGCSFYPDHHNDHEWIGVIPAERLLTEIDIDELEQKEVKLPHRKQQLINVLKNLKEDDNPVLMIVKLK